MLVTNTTGRRSIRGEAGYSLVELMMTCAVIAILGAMAMTISLTAVARSKADAAVTGAVSQIEIARNRAIAERRNVEIHFDMPNQIRLERVEPDGSTTNLSTMVLENNLEFKKFPGVDDTPDNFGSGNVIDFDGPQPVMFTSDGSLVDSAGDPTNGTILLGTGNDKQSARAITLFGMTGLIQSWKWVATEWTSQ